MGKVRFDRIDYWSEVKLDIVEEYARVYSTIVSRQPAIRAHLYVDAFSGPGVHVSKQSGELIPGSPLNGLSIRPKFTEYHFIDLDGDKVDLLKKMVGNRTDVTVHTGDCNQILLSDVFPRCRYGDYRRALCLLDPYGLNVNWEVLETAGKMGSVEIFYNFMIMDANRNVLWKNPRMVPEAQKERNIIYYLYFASPNETGARIVGQIFDKYRSRGV
jgi:three-Cys-motif partner protein